MNFSDQFYPTTTAVDSEEQRSAMAVARSPGCSMSTVADGSDIPLAYSDDTLIMYVIVTFGEQAIAGIPSFKSNQIERQRNTDGIGGRLNLPELLSDDSNPAAGEGHRASRPAWSMGWTLRLPRGGTY